LNGEPYKCPIIIEELLGISFKTLISQLSFLINLDNFILFKKLFDLLNILIGRLKYKPIIIVKVGMIINGKFTR
jgi:hypothetical protein